MVSKLLFLCVFVIVADGESQMSVPEVVDPDSLMAYGNAARQDIINAYTAKRYWTVLRLNNDGKFKCGAVLISMNAALTTKDCVKETNKLSVIAGNPTRDQVTRNVTGTVKHPCRNAAIVKFEALPKNSAYRNVSIANITLKGLSKLPLEFYGFGRYHENITVPSKELRWTRAKIVPPCKCEATYKSLGPNELCTVLYWTPRWKPSFCAGDEGGAVLMTDVIARKYRVVGVISKISKACTPAEGGIVTYVFDIQEWISQNTKNV